MGVASGLEGGFTCGVDMSVEVGDEGVEVGVVEGCLVCFDDVLERFLPFFFEFRVGVVSCRGGGREGKLP